MLSHTALIAVSLVVMKTRSASSATFATLSTTAMPGKRFDNHLRCSGRREDVATTSPFG